RGSEEATAHSATLVVKLDGRELERRSLGWDNRKSISISAEASLKKGANTFALEIIPEHPPGEGENKLYADVGTVSLNGPLDRSYLDYPRNYHRIFLEGAPPLEAGARREYRRKLIRHFADRAFRRL